MLFYLEMNSKSSVTADLDPPPRFKSASGYEPPSQIWTFKRFLNKNEVTTPTTSLS